MIELPEALVIANQLEKTIKGKRISGVVAAHSPHKFAWFFGEPEEYDKLMSSKTIGETKSYGGLIEISVEDCVILFGDGVRIRYHTNKEKLPVKHQLLISFDDDTFLSCSVQMYGGMWCFKDGENDNLYYKIAKEKPSPYSNDFNEEYFFNLLEENSGKLSMKAFLATEQRIPGLGNGVLQDILWKAKIHPKRKISSLDEKKIMELYNSVKITLKEMAEKGGRDREKDIFGIKGGYETIMSSKNVGEYCPVCGAVIEKGTYMGGSIYYCRGCQKDNI